MRLRRPRKTKKPALPGARLERTLKRHMPTAGRLASRARARWFSGSLPTNQGRPDAADLEVDNQQQRPNLLHHQHREQRGEGLREVGGISGPNNKQLGAQEQELSEADVQGGKGMPPPDSKGGEGEAAPQVLPTGKITITQQITACACDVATITTWTLMRSARTDS